MKINSDVLYTARKKKRLSLEALGKKVGVGRTQMSHIQTGKSGTSKARAKELARILGVPLKLLARAYIYNNSGKDR